MCSSLPNNSASARGTNGRGGKGKHKESEHTDEEARRNTTSLSKRLHTFTTHLCGMIQTGFTETQKHTAKDTKGNITSLIARTRGRGDTQKVGEKDAGKCVDITPSLSV